MWKSGLALFLIVIASLGSCAPTLPPRASTGVGHNLSGSALFMVDFDYATGKVTSVHVLKSTGSEELDAISIRRLEQWHSKPRTITHKKVPITFTIRNADS